MLINNVSVKMMIDSGSTANIIDKETFGRIKRKSEVMLKKTSTKIYPYGSTPLKLLGYFQPTIETTKRITTNKCREHGLSW